MKLLFMRIQEHISLKELTTLKVGGVARYFCSVEKAEELSEALAFAREKKIGFSVLGGGSNVLIADKDINALVIKIDIKETDWQAGKDILKFRQSDIARTQNLNISKSQYVLVIAGAGENWDGLVAKAVRRGLWGIENLSGIPGTVGAAPIQNIGAYGTEIKETLAWVEVFDTKTEKLRKLSNKACTFGYRDSIFKHPEGKPLIVTRVALRLKKSGVPNLEYKDLKHYFYGGPHSPFPKGGGESSNRRISKSLGLRPLPLGKGESPAPSVIRRVVLKIRSHKFPDLRKFGTAGSFFKNPVVSKKQFDALKRRFPDLPGFEVSFPCSNLTANSYKLKAIKIPLAWILDNVCDLKGFGNGNVRLFEKQPIVLVNLGGATAEEVLTLAKQVIDCVKEKTGIVIELEVQSMR